MLHIVLGPTFEHRLETPPAEAAGQLRAWLAAPHCPAKGTVVGDHFNITVPDRQRRFWSPHLTVQLTAEDGATVLHARFNPHPSIWTAVMFAYLALGTIAVSAAVWGGVELLLDRTPIAFLIVPACFLLVGAVFWITYLGQVVADDQMTQLREDLERALDITPPA